MLFAYTFGDSKAARILCEILDKRNKKTRHNVCRQITKFTEILNSIATISNQEHKVKLALMLLNYYLHFFDNVSCIASDFELLSFYKNILKMKYRQIV